MPGTDPSANRTSGFWATLGQEYLQVAENTLPQLGAATSDALAQRVGGTAPDTNVTPNAQPGTTSNTPLYVFIGLLFLLVLFGLAGLGGRHHRE